MILTRTLPVHTSAAFRAQHISKEIGQKLKPHLLKKVTLKDLRESATAKPSQ